MSASVPRWHAQKLTHPLALGDPCGFFLRSVHGPLAHLHELGALTGDNPVGKAQVGSALPTAIQDEDLMPSERRFRDDGTKATRFYKPDDGDDQMNEKDEDIVHAASYQNLKIPRNSGRFGNSPRTGQTQRKLRSAMRGLREIGFQPSKDRFHVL